MSRSHRAPTPLAVEVTGLRKRYGSTEALRGVNLAVPAGTVLGVLGPNGAGKTTTVRILSTLVEADEGTATVAGFDVARQPNEVRRRIGLAGQYAAVDERLTPRENLVMVGRLYHLGSARAKARAEEMLQRFDLADAANRPVKTFSGGMRRRLDLAASLLANPVVLFLDEPTTGLDPASRLALWGLIRQQVAQGTTVLLTTQYLEEADQLADNIVVIDSGQVIAEGTPDQLKAKVGGERLEITPANPADLHAMASTLTGVFGAPPALSPDGRTLAVPLTYGMRAISAAAASIDAAGLQVADFAVRRPSLDDVFLTLTGHKAMTGQESA